MCKKLLSNIWLLSILPVLAVATSLYASIQTGQWQWLARSGAIVAICGALLGFRPVIRVGLVEWVTAERIIDGGNLSPTTEELEAAHQTKLDYIANEAGILAAIAGTLLWGYGDLFGKVFGT